MSKIGIIGGIGPESTIKYYQQIIQGYRDKTNHKAYPELHLANIDMTQMLSLISNNDTAGFLAFMKQRIDPLAKLGIEKVFVASNTPHFLFDALQEIVSVELVSIVTETIAIAQKLQLQKLGLIGTKFTMSKGFYEQKGLLKGIEIVVPNAEDQELIHNVYMNELVFNVTRKESKKMLLSIIKTMETENQIKGIILGGTELSLLLAPSDFEALKVLDTCSIHAAAIVNALVAS